MKIAILAVLISCAAFGQTTSAGPAVFSGFGLNLKDFGAKCDGATDDRAAIQAAIDATGSGTLTLPPASCAVSPPGIFLYPANSGMTLNGNSSTTNFNGGGGGLIASTATSASAVLTVYAQNVKLNNLLLDCHAKAAANGIVTAFGLASVWINVTTRNCSGDGGQANAYATPATSIKSGGTIGSRAVTVASITNNRLTFGSQTCSVVMFDYDTPNEEQSGISSVSGNILNVSPALAHAHTTARCAGNNNSMHIMRYSSFGNGGWGWHVFHGSDNNDFWWEDGSSNSNTLGGELWSGVSHKHYGGSYQGDAGPAIQLGTIGTIDSKSGRTSNMTMGPPGDLEEGGFSGVLSVCDGESQVQFVDPSNLTITTGPSSCFASGSSTEGIGTSASAKGFFLKMTAGNGLSNYVFPIGVDSVLFQTGSGPGITCYRADSSGGGKSSCLIRLDGTNGSGAEVPYAGLASAINDNTPGAQKGSLHMKYVTGGVLTDGLIVNDDGTTTAPHYAGSKAPVCFDAHGNIYPGNNSGTGVPCP